MLVVRGNEMSGWLVGCSFEKDALLTDKIILLCIIWCAEKTNSLIAFLSVGALCTCIGLAAFQVWSLRKFFKRKKVL